MDKSEQTDHELLDAIRAGSEIAFRRLIFRYQTQLKRFVAVFLPSPASVDDVVQDTFIAFWFEIVKKGKEVDKLRSLLFRIAHNKAVDKIRQERWYAFFDVLESDFPSPHSPQKELRHKQLEEIFAGALKQLPRWDREIMVLYYVERLLIKEIADITSMSVEAVSTRLRRSREKMKELLPDTFYTDWIETHEIQKKINI